MKSHLHPIKYLAVASSTPCYQENEARPLICRLKYIFEASALSGEMHGCNILLGSFYFGIIFGIIIS